MRSKNRTSNKSLLASRLTGRELIEQRRPLGATRPSRPPNCSMKPTPLAALAASASPRPLRRVEASGFSAPWGGGLSRAPLGSQPERRRNHEAY